MNEYGIGKAEITIAGCGEVGRAHALLLKDSHSVSVVDPVSVDIPGVEHYFPTRIMAKTDVLMIAMRYSEEFVKTCIEYVKKTSPEIICVLSTVPVGTSRRIREDACHSTTRGLHPTLVEGLKHIGKHIGGPHAGYLKTIFTKAGFKVSGTHARPETTELAHILNNTAYGVNLMLADDLQKICRHYGVDYVEAVINYGKSNNEGFVELDNPTKVRPILTPPNGHIGGHCVGMSAGLIPEDLRGDIINKLAHYGEKK